MEVAPPQAPAVERGGLGVVIVTALVFLVLGPPIGVITYIAGMIMWDIGNTDLKSLLGLPLILLIAVPLSYIAGALPALGTGVLIGLWQAFRGKLVWPAAVAIGLAAGGIMDWFKLLDVADMGPAPWPITLATCCVPTLICWYIMHNFIGARIEQNDQSTPAPR